MKLVLKYLCLIILINFYQCKRKTNQASLQTQHETKFNFSSIEKFKNSKTKGVIINDYDHILTTSQKENLREIIYNYYQKTTRQIAVVTTDTLYSYSDIHKFSIDLFNYWGLGTKEENNGLAIVLCKPCRQISIATGLGTQLVLTDSICKNIIDTTMLPKFKNQKFYEGIHAGIKNLIEEWK